MDSAWINPTSQHLEAATAAIRNVNPDFHVHAGHVTQLRGTGKTTVECLQGFRAVHASAWKATLPGWQRDTLLKSTSGVHR